MTVRASVVLPISTPVLRDGMVSIKGDRIERVCPWKSAPLELRRQAVELGDVLLMPGLVNAHCHLDYTHMAGQLPPQRSFTDWLKLIVATKSEWSLEDYARSWRDGAGMLLRHGTTTVADIEAVPQLLPVMWEGTPLRVISFLEMIGITPARAAKMVLAETLRQVKRLRPGAFGLGLSPHAPYSTTPELLRQASATARSRSLRLTTHVAESATEVEMFREGKGEMFEWIRRSGRDTSDCGQGSPVAQVAKCGLLRVPLIAVHVNYLSRGDARRLAAGNASVVHCPRSHFYFGHGRFPLQTLVRAGVNVCLGTDSLASVYRRRGETVELDMFAEMRQVAQAEPKVSARRIVQMATVNGARALGLEGAVGELKRGALADLIVLPAPGKGGDAYKAVLHSDGPVLRTMIGGSWVEPSLPG